MNIREPAYVPWPVRRPEEHRDLIFLSPLSMQTYVHQDMFIGYVPRGTDEYRLCSSTIIVTPCLIN
jgi:hypothetical protein